MPRIPSPNPDFSDREGQQARYPHPAEGRKNHPIPVAFQVTSPFSRYKVLLPHTLVMHVNPRNISESYNQKVERFQTRGGFQEQHWGQDLTEISAEASTGAFMNIHTGLSSVVRQRTIAWDRYRDLHDLYRHNGSVYDPFGNIVLQGQLMLMYDRGVYLGTFRSFEFEETDDSPFAFKLNWSFKVEHTWLDVPYTPFDGIPVPAPHFQGENLPVGAREEAAARDRARQDAEAQQREAAEEAAEHRREQIAQVDENIAEAERQAEFDKAAEQFDPLRQSPEEQLGIADPKQPAEDGDQAVFIPKGL